MHEENLLPAGTGFWEALDRLVSASTIVIDRPKGSTHPRYPSVRYPVDYGYLANTRSADGGGIDVWLGSSGGQRPHAVIVTVDLLQRDSEIKVVIGCTEDELSRIMIAHNGGLMRGLLVKRTG